ncbi:MAG: hypothetical protein ACTSQY_07115 [Candidatus Odinarchaeia archaeon]
MSSNEEVGDLQEFLVDALKNINKLTKKIDEMNKNVNSSVDKIEDRISKKLENLEKYFHSIKGTTELLKELLAELRVLVPVLHLTKLIDETKLIFSGAPPQAYAAQAPAQQQAVKPTPPAPATTAASAKKESLFKPEKVEFKEPVKAKKDKTPDVVYSSRVPSYIKNKKKPKSLWEGIRDEE